MQDELRGLRDARDQDQALLEHLTDAARELLPPSAPWFDAHGLRPARDDGGHPECEEPGKQECRIELSARDQIPGDDRPRGLTRALDG